MLEAMTFTHHSITSTPCPSYIMNTVKSHTVTGLLA